MRYSCFLEHVCTEASHGLCLVFYKELKKIRDPEAPNTKTIYFADLLQTSRSFFFLPVMMVSFHSSALQIIVQTKSTKSLNLFTCILFEGHFELFERSSLGLCFYTYSKSKILVGSYQLYQVKQTQSNQLYRLPKIAQNY